MLTRTSRGAPTEAGYHASRGRLDPLDSVLLVVAAGGLEHLRRRVDADDPGPGPPVGEAERQRAVATAQVDDDRGVDRHHAGEEVGEGPAPEGAEQGVLLRVPGHRGVLCSVDA